MSSNKVEIHVRLQGGEFTRVGWYPGTSDESIGLMISAALGLDEGAPVILRDEADGCLVPVCAQLPVGGEFSVAPEFGTFGGGGGGSLGGSSLFSAPTGPTPRRRSAAAEDDGAARGGGGDLVGESSLSKPLLDADVGHDVGPTTVQEKIENNVTKFERMASHLANERTFLAWIRTAVSVAGLALTYSDFFHHPNNVPFFYWMSTLFSWGVCLATFFVGLSRYQRVKFVLNLPKTQITNRFGRTGITIIIASFSTFLVLLTIVYIDEVWRDQGL
mmetsp:Transcript_48244/g.135019  ORF Transcript_48244/g.135019 Transcript_48244/m.135019 type:complete len:274 (+) Transcript_48244:1020-1841(+)